MWRGKLSLRRLNVIFKNLPATSATARKLQPDLTRWGESEYLLAHIADLLASANWQRGADPEKPPPRPEPYPRPGQAEAKASRVLAKAKAWRAAQTTDSEGGSDV